MRRPLVLLVVVMLGAVACQSPPPGKPAAPRLQQGGFTAELNGFPIHYEVHGRGPVVMTVPNSWGLSHQGLRALYRPLEDRLTIVYFDPRGMGQSGAVREPDDMGLAAVRADFVALARHLGLAKVNAIGWSNGAMNLIYLAAEQPELIETAIFVHGVARWGEDDAKAMAESHPELVEKWGAFNREIKASDDPPEVKTERLREFWLTTSFPAMVADQARSLDLMQQVFRDAQLSYPHMAHAGEEVPSFDARATLASIRARCLVIAGSHDMAPVDRAREMREGLPSAELAVFENSGHFAPVEEPEKFRTTIFAFLGVAGAS